jgi:hypothetical protein
MSRSLFVLKGTLAEYGAGLKLAIERGWLEIHENRTYVKFTQVGAVFCAMLPLPRHNQRRSLGPRCFDFDTERSAFQLSTILIAILPSPSISEQRPHRSWRNRLRLARWHSHLLQRRAWAEVHNRWPERHGHASDGHRFPAISRHNSEPFLAPFRPPIQKSSSIRCPKAPNLRPSLSDMKAASPEF